MLVYVCMCVCVGEEGIYIRKVFITAGQLNFNESEIKSSKVCRYATALLAVFTGPL